MPKINNNRLPWYHFIFKNDDVAREWIPKFEAIRQDVRPKNCVQSVSKLKLMDYDREFALDPEPQVIAAGFESLEGKEISLDDVVKQMFRVADDSINFVATCKCGDLRGNYHLNSICPKCGTKVRSAFADEVNFGGWLVIPDELPPFLHPVVYRVLRRWMGKLCKQPVYLLDAILNPETELPEEYRGKFQQGMCYLATGNNLFDIVNLVMSIKKGARAADNNVITEFLNEYRQSLFVRHIPILNQSLHIMTKSGTMTYNDSSSEFILKTYLELNSTIYAKRHRPDMNPVYFESRVWSIFTSWMQYVNSVIDPKLSGKTGFIRKNLLGTRMHGSARAVIAPITRQHDADYIELPWRMTVGLFKLEIMNILENRYGYDVNEALKLFNNALVTYNETVDGCLKTLHNECLYKGFPILMGRNPKV